MTSEDVVTGRHSLMEEVAAALASGMSSRDKAYVHLFASSPFAMWVYDVDTLMILDANDAAQARYGYSHSEFTCLSLRDIRPTEDVPKFLELTSHLPHFDRSGPWRHRVADGSVIQVLITSHDMRFGPHKARLVIVEDPDEAPV